MNGVVHSAHALQVWSLMAYKLSMFWLKEVIRCMYSYIVCIVADLLKSWLFIINFILHGIIIGCGHVCMVMYILLAYAGGMHVCTH